MKTAIFINTFAKMNNYDLIHLSSYDIRKVAIVSEDEFNKFDSSYGKYFSEIYSCANTSNNQFEKISYDFAKNVTQRELSKHSDGIRIICLSEDNLLLAAQLRSEYSIPGMKFENAQIFRDKTMMKDVLRKKGIRTPRFLKFEDLRAKDVYAYFEFIKNQVSIPFVIKPTNMLGGLGVVIIRSLDEFKIFCEEKKENSYEYEVEEFISGTLFHCDSIVKNDDIIFSVCCEYSNPNFDFQLGKSVVSIPLENNDPITKRIFEFNKNVLNAMGLNQGISHHELFLTQNDELVFLEIAARSPGAIVTPMYRNAFNIGLEDIDFKMQMDIPFELSPTFDTHYLSGIFPLFSGTIDKLISPEIKSKHDMKWVVKNGETTTASKSLRDKSASITAWNKHYKELRDDFIYLKEFQSISVE